MPSSHPLFNAALATLLFTYGAIILGEHGQHYPAFAIGLIWYAAAAAGSFLFLLARGTLRAELDIVVKNPRHSLPVVLWGAGDGICWFLGLLLLGLAGYSVVSRVSLFLLTAYSFFILKEKHTRQESVWTILILIATVLFSLGLKPAEELTGFIITLGGALFSTLFVIAKKKNAVAIPPMAPQMLRAGLIWLCILALYFVVPHPALSPADIPLPAALLIASGGISNAVFGQYLRMLAFRQGEQLATITLILNMLHVLTFFYGIILLGEDGNIWKYSAAGLMVLAVTALSWSKAKMVKKEYEASP